MKTIVALLLTILLSPFLVCDPQAGVETYELYFDGAVTPAVSQPVNNAIRYDLASIPAGTHTVIAKACNTWGCSESSTPFTFTKVVLGAPVNIGLGK